MTAAAASATANGSVAGSDRAWAAALSVTLGSVPTRAHLHLRQNFVEEGASKPGVPAEEGVSDQPLSLIHI